jgi:hypothetical protein
LGVASVKGPEATQYPKDFGFSSYIFDKSLIEVEYSFDRLSRIGDNNGFGGVASHTKE